MHERALLRDLVRKVNEVAASHGSPRVTCVRLRLGALCHVTPALLQERWPEVSGSTPAAAARLEIEASDDLRDSLADQVVIRSVDLAEPAPPASS